jgi:glycosyltransferase involved in cell wall biosynthesis
MAANSQKPFVSVLTPTYNRRRFIPALIKCYMSQTYPHDRMEWLILDDGQESTEDIFKEAAKFIPNIRYMREPIKHLIGAKRNRLHKEAKGEIFVCFDDDDFYYPDRVSHCVLKFQQNPKINLAGSSVLFMYYTQEKKILELGPYGPNHATNGTMAVRSSYAKTHFYDESVTHAEEISFLERYKHPMIQLDPFKVMLVISHSENTFDKRKFLTKEQLDNNPFIKMSKLKLKDFIKDKDVRAFYENA